MENNTFYTASVALTVALGGFLMGFDASVISGVVGFIETEFQLSKIQLGWAVASLTLTATLAMMVAGPLSDRLGRRPVLTMAAVLFAISAVAYRGATLEVTMPSPLLTAAVTLLMVITFQSVVMAVWIYLRDRPQFRAVWNSRTTAVWVGITSLGGSLGWFTAFALQNAAYVKALGQIEIILSVMVGYFFFKERLARREVIAMSLLVISILMLILLT